MRSDGYIAVGGPPALRRHPPDGPTAGAAHESGAACLPAGAARTAAAAPTDRPHAHAPTDRPGAGHANRPGARRRRRTLVRPRVSDPGYIYPTSTRVYCMHMHLRILRCRSSMRCASTTHHHTCTVDHRLAGHSPRTTCKRVIERSVATTWTTMRDAEQVWAPAGRGADDAEPQAFRPGATSGESDAHVGQRDVRRWCNDEITAVDPRITGGSPVWL